MLIYESSAAYAARVNALHLCDEAEDCAEGHLGCATYAGGPCSLPGQRELEALPDEERERIETDAEVLS